MFCIQPQRFDAGAVMDVIIVNGRAWVGKAIRSFQTECQKQTFLPPDQSVCRLYVSRTMRWGPLISF